MDGRQLANKTSPGTCIHYIFLKRKLRKTPTTDTCLHPPHSIWWRFPARRKPSQNGGVLLCVRWNGGKCICRLVQGLLTLADPVLHFTHAGNYDRRTLNTIATSSSQHHNRLARRFATQAVVGNKANRYYRVHISVITDNNHNGMAIRKASRLCGRNSSARVRTYACLLATNQCYPGTLQAGKSGFHIVQCAIPESWCSTEPPADAPLSWKPHGSVRSKHHYPEPVQATTTQNLYLNNASDVKQL
jgi:hypothetical protein